LIHFYKSIFGLEAETSDPTDKNAACS